MQKNQPANFKMMKIVFLVLGISGILVGSCLLFLFIAFHRLDRYLKSDVVTTPYTGELTADQAYAKIQKMYSVYVQASGDTAAKKAESIKPYLTAAAYSDLLESDARVEGVSGGANGKPDPQGDIPNNYDFLTCDLISNPIVAVPTLTNLRKYASDYQNPTPLPNHRLEFSLDMTYRAAHMEDGQESIGINTVTGLIVTTRCIL